MKASEFKEFVDKSLPLSKGNDGRVDSRIKMLLPSDCDKTILYRVFQRLGKGLLREQLLEGVDNQRYIDVVEIIHNHLGWNQTKIKSFDNNCWKDVIAACKEEMPLQRADWLEEFDKEHRRAKAAKQLRKFGVKIRVENNDYVIDNEDIVYDALTSWVREAGGRRFLNLLLMQMEYLDSEGRFLTDMSGNIPNPKDVVIVKPYNYLVNLALANINAEGGSNKEATIAFGKAIGLATDFCFVRYPVQSFGSVWDDLFHRDRDTVEFFTDLVYKESIFGLSQHSIWFSKMFCERVLKFMRDSGQILPRDYSFDEYESLMNYCLSVADPCKCVEIKRGEIKGISPETLDKLLEDVSTGSDIINKGFKTPLDEEKENAANKPLIKIRDRYYALPATIGSWGWFEALMIVVRERNKNIDAEVGKMMEDYINEKLDEKGIVHCCGTYSPPPDSEADLVVEASNGIMLFEMKKKSLTRKAKAGNGFKVVSDLLGSLLDSQAQCFRTSHLLIQQGYVDLDDNGKVTKVERGGRESECITVCLGAFGPLQDRLLIKSIMEETCKHQLQAGYDGDDKQTIKDVNKFNKDMQKWLPFLKEEMKNGDSKKNPFFNSWFLDLEQLMVLMRDVNSNDELLERLRETKYITGGSYSFYRERIIARMMRKTAKS